jgi:hypothetical protein
MKNILVSLLFVGCVSCGSKDSTLHVSDSVKDYVDTVMSWCGQDVDCHHHSKLESIKLGSMASNKLGVCYIEYDNVGVESRRVVLNRSFWHDASDDQRLELVAHELGHCNWNGIHQAKGLMTATNLNGGNIKELFLDWYFATVKRLD